MPASEASFRKNILTQNNSIDLKVMQILPTHTKSGSSYMSQRKNTMKTT